MKKALAGGVLGLDLVAWGGIEPPTRGFSIAVLNFYPVFMRVTARKRVT